MPAPQSGQIDIQPESIQQLLRDWQAEHGRKTLPWQTNPTPYRVWVSEIMLQQTQVQTVIPYFERWMTRFSSVENLASATLDQVMASWQGLGYYNRARNLHQGARYVTEELGGIFPKTVDGLLQIPGVGRYTAGAIMAFAYDRPAPIVDGNIKRLFARMFGVEGVPSQTAVTQTLWQLAEQLTPPTQNRIHAQALLDMGATICTPKNPACDTCPVGSHCHAKQHDCVAHLPTPKARKKKPTRDAVFLWAESGDCILLEKRQHSVWRDLWCLPEIEAPSVITPKDITGTFQHHFTHYQLHATVVHQTCAKSPQNAQWIHRSELAQYGMPTPIKRFINQQSKLVAA